jgi:hypothetical protein
MGANRIRGANSKIENRKSKIENRYLLGELVAVILIAMDRTDEGDQVVHLAMGIGGELGGCHEAMVEERDESQGENQE